MTRPELASITTLTRCPSTTSFTFQTSRSSTSLSFTSNGVPPTPESAILVACSSEIAQVLTRAPSLFASITRSWSYFMKSPRQSSTLPSSRRRECTGFGRKGPATKVGCRINKLGGTTRSPKSLPFSFANIQTISKGHIAYIGERLGVSGGLEFGGARAQGGHRPITGDIAALWCLFVPVSRHNHEQCVCICFASSHWGALP